MTFATSCHITLTFKMKMCWRKIDRFTSWCNFANLCYCVSNSLMSQRKRGIFQAVYSYFSGFRGKKTPIFFLSPLYSYTFLSLSLTFPNNSSWQGIAFLHIMWSTLSQERQMDPSEERLRVFCRPNMRESRITWFEICSPTSYAVKVAMKCCFLL